MDTIAVIDFKKITGMVKVIDLRDNYKYNLNKIPNSINVPFSFLITNPDDYINKNDTYYLICEYGKKSLEVSKILNRQGYKTISILGGYRDYQKEVSD